MVKKKEHPNHSIKACPKPPGVHVPYARAAMSAKKPILPIAISILIVIGWLVFILLFNYFLLIDVTFFQNIIITIVSFLVIGLLIGLTCAVWSFRAGESKVRVRPIVGGILVIIAALISLFNGLSALVGSHQGLSWTPSPTGYKLIYYLTLLVIGFFALIGFALGLAAGIQSLRRKQFRFAMLGISLLMFAGLSNFLNGAVIVLRYSWAWNSSSFVWFFLFGVPVVGLALLGLVFVATGKQEFARVRDILVNRKI